MRNNEEQLILQLRMIESEIRELQSRKEKYLVILESDLENLIEERNKTLLQLKKIRK